LTFKENDPQNHADNYARDRLELAENSFQRKSGPMSFKNLHRLVGLKGAHFRSIILIFLKSCNPLQTSAPIPRITAGPAVLVCVEIREAIYKRGSNDFMLE